MRLIVIALIAQVLTAPDPLQMEKAPAFPYRPVPHGLALGDGYSWGAPSSVATSSRGHTLVFNRGPQPLFEFDRAGRFVRGFGAGRYERPHGMRLDSDDNIWTTDVAGHTVTKMNWRGEVLLTLGTRGEAGEWNEAAGSRLLTEPNDVAIAPNGDVFIVQGHGKGEPRVLKFTAAGRFVRSWGGKGSGPGQFDIAHSIVVDAKQRVYVADRQNRRVQVFDNDGRFVTEWKFAGLPCGLFISPSQRLFMVSGFAGQVLELDFGGRVLAAMGQPGKGLGEFGEAHYLTLGVDDEIYVADTVQPALHKFVRQ